MKWGVYILARVNWDTQWLKLDRRQYLWPVLEFVGATIIISLLHGLLVLNNALSSVIKLGLVFYLAVICYAAFIPLSLGNNSLQLPKLGMAKLKHPKFIRGNNGWMRKFVRSCGPISLKFDSFHEMDKIRSFNLMRFILQRAFFLVFKTKQDGLNLISLIIYSLFQSKWRHRWNALKFTRLLSKIQKSKLFFLVLYNICFNLVKYSIW